MTLPALVKKADGKRVKIIANEIAIFAPDSDRASMHFVTFEFLDSRFENLDKSLRFPKTAEIAETIWKKLPADYELSDDFRSLLVTQKRVEIIGNEIAIFAPDAHQATADQEIYESNNRALSRYEPHDQSLRFPKTTENAETIWEVLSADADYVFSDDFKSFCKARQRVEIIDGEIAVFLLYPDCASLRIQEPKGRYNDADRSFRYSLSDALALTPLLPPKIERSPEFCELLAEAIRQNEYKQMKRIDLLLDEHPDHCVAVYYPRENAATIDPEYFHFAIRWTG
jgi:hypothetical protein